MGHPPRQCATRSGVSLLWLAGYTALFLTLRFDRIGKRSA
jgi:hypothetical protein